MCLKSRAFTLIELLVVIAIIAILAAILFPVFAQAKLAAKKTVGLSDAKQIGLGLYMYANDYDDMCVMSGTWSPVNGFYATPTINNAQQAFGSETYDEALNPYIKNFDLWHVPADGVAAEWDDTDYWLWDGQFIGKPARRSFDITSHIDTNEAGGWLDRNTGISPSPWDIVGGFPVRNLTEFSDPSGSVAFAEIWVAPDPNNVGGGGRISILNDSFMFGCDTWKLAGRIPLAGDPGDQLPIGGDGCDSIASDPTRIPTQGYNGRANYVMMDGSAKALGWGQIRKNDFSYFKVQKSSTVFVP
jgi:prepilin-type N-terminal cleavage/methylation domain-containing protein/prepilin-type processing-associated H-X9-DG protein